MNVLKEMIKEEWRMHSDLFGYRGFALFPLAVLLVSVFLVFSFNFTGFSLHQIYLGALSLLFFMGLNVGGLGFISRDASSNLLGDVNLLIFSSRTLPVSERFLVGNFLLKDLLYYMVFMVAPVALAPLFLKPFLGVSVARVLTLLVSGTGTFMLGVGISFTFASLHNRGEAYIYGGILASALAILLGRSQLLGFTPFGTFSDPSISSAVTGFSSVVLFMATALIFYSSEPSKTQRSSADTYRLIHDRLGLEDPMATKSLLDLNRSGGGLWKVVVSEAVIFGFFSLLMMEMDFLKAVVSAPGMAYGLMMSIGAVSVYNWLTRFDSEKNYSILPLDTGEVLESKLKIFLVVSVPVAWTFTAIGAYFFGMEGLIPGFLAVPLVNLYLAGAVAYLAGMKPNQMLFDATNFLLFVVLVSIGLVPLFVLSLLYSVFPLEATAGYVAGSLVLGLAGYGLYQRAETRWR